MQRILILGAARSGVTAVGEAVAAAANLPLRQQGFGLGLFQAIDAAGIAYADRIAPWGGGADGDFEALRSRFMTLANLPPANGSAGNEVSAAADLLPECPNLIAAGSILTESADARAVIVWRDAVPFIGSRCRAWPNISFLSHCHAWANAMRKGRRLADRFPDQVLLVRHNDLLRDGAGQATRLAQFLNLPASAARRAVQALETHQAGRSGAILQAAVVDPAKAGWTMPELEVFDAVCGRELALSGVKIDLASAERMRPVDVAAMLLARGRGTSGVAITPSGARSGAPRIAVREMVQAAKAYVSPLVAGKRQTFSLQIDVEKADAGAALRCEVVESLSRRALIVRDLPLRDREISFTDALPPHDGLLDFTLTQRPGDAPAAFSILLNQASLAHR